jgi:hypothetical protein
MTDFSTWSHANLVKFANDSTQELLFLRNDLRVAIDAYRTLLKEVPHEQNLQQLPVEQLQPDGSESYQPRWPHIQVDLF